MSTTIVTDYTLPYPFEPWNSINRLTSPIFANYKAKVLESAKRNTKRYDVSRYITWIDTYVKESETKKKLKAWIGRNSDKIVYCMDMSWLKFGIIIEEDTERVVLKYPRYLDENEKNLYVGYDEAEFEKLSFIQKLNWMYENCEFIPLRINHESFFDFDDPRPHLFSHIKKDKQAAENLSGFLKAAKYPPSDNKWYYICYGRNGYYLRKAENQER